MPLVAPNLDQRTFEQLVAEVRRRIPTLTPEWTDLNEGDPGITLAELFAFMTEHLLFQVNQVPEKGLITFLQMVGIELHPASPAVTDVTFTPKPGPGGIFLLSPGTQVRTSGPPPGQKEPLTFETTRQLPTLNGSLVDLVSRDCTLTFVSHKTANDALTQSFRPFGKATSTQDIFYLVFDLNDRVGTHPWPVGKFQVRVNLAGSSDVGDPPDPEFESETPKRIQWGYSSGTAVAFDDTVSLVFTDTEPSKDSTLEFTRSGYLEFDFDADEVNNFTFSNEEELVPQFFRNFLVLRAQIAREDAYQGLPIPALGTVRLNTVPAKNVKTIQDERLGSSSGLPFQRFRFANAPVVPDSTALVVDERAEGGSPEAVWSETKDLFAAGPNDRVYQLLPATGEILFGNGEFGKIPPPDDGDALSVNITASRYQFGGGLAGNTGAQTLKNVVLIDAVASEFDATNVLQAAGGAEEEPVQQGLERAPAVVRSRFRAVTAEDFEALARETPEVRVDRSFALASTRPGITIGQSPGSVTVLLVPHVPFENSINAPIDLQSHIAAAVLRFLDERRLITTEVFTAAPPYHKITVRTTLVAEPGESVNDTRNAAIVELQRYFHPLVGGADGTGWPFGGTIFFSRVFERLLSVPGIERAVSVALSLDDGDFVECEDIPIGRGDLLFSGNHIVVVQGG